MTAGGHHPLRVVVTLSAAEAQPWMDLFRHALPEADIERREPGQPVHAAEPAADYVVLAEPCRTVFDAQRTPKAVFTASAGVGLTSFLQSASAPPPVLSNRDEAQYR